jgi:flagellar biosynthesis protein FlgN
MKIWLGRQPDNQTAAVNWENLLDLAREAKQLHELNASLVGMNLQQTNEALAILRKPAQHTLYGSNGQTSPFSGSRIVDSA